MTQSPDLHARQDRLRELFLAEAERQGALPDYWRDAADLAAYQPLLAARIGWKWDAALTEAEARGLALAPGSRVLDFGCGTGIASERVAARFPGLQFQLHDRSPLAMQFAQQQLQERGIAAWQQPNAVAQPVDAVLVSHVLTELDSDSTAALQQVCAGAKLVLVVEPGTRAASRRLAQWRETMRAQWRVLAPCPHQTACPTLGKAQDWCHFFATPPAEVFTSAAWVSAARRAGIDLRSLPYAFLVLAKHAASPLPPSAHRLLGRPQLGKHEAKLLACQADGSLTEHRVIKRATPQLWRMLKKHPQGLRELPSR